MNDNVYIAETGSNDCVIGLLGLCKLGCLVNCDLCMIFFIN